MTLAELKLLCATKLDVTEFLDLIGYDMFELVEALEPAIQENYQELVRACE
jgi:hypothetical protein